MDAVIAALRRAGIAERDIQTSAINLQPRYSNPDRDAMIRARETREPYVPPAQPQAPTIIGYEAHNNVQVRVRRLGEMGRIIDTLIEAGANQVNGPSFTMDEPGAALDEARAEAVAIARQRAEIYARAAGMRVVRILSISEGGGYYPVQQVFGESRMAAPAPPPPPIAPGRADARRQRLGPVRAHALGRVRMRSRLLILVVLPAALAAAGRPAATGRARGRSRPRGPRILPSGCSPRTTVNAPRSGCRRCAGTRRWPRRPPAMRRGWLRWGGSSIRRATPVRGRARISGWARPAHIRPSRWSGTGRGRKPGSGPACFRTSAAPATGWTCRIIRR